MLSVQNVVKCYGHGNGEVPALRGVSFDLALGEFLAVVGPSGSGKSTLLSILGGLNTPDQGSYFVDGLDVYGLHPEKRADFRREYIGFVFQSFQLVPYLTLLENAMLPLVPKKMKPRLKQGMALEALRLVGLADKAYRLPAQTSGGEQERAAVARAIVNHPPLLLADEPTGNLDSATGCEVMDALEGLNAAGMTIILVTHNQEYAGRAGRSLEMLDGRLAGTPLSEPVCPGGEVQSWGER
jgi:putative ABC transport system ATP-binding protein